MNEQLIEIPEFWSSQGVSACLGNERRLGKRICRSEGGGGGCDCPHNSYRIQYCSPYRTRSSHSSSVPDGPYMDQRIGFSAAL